MDEEALGPVAGPLLRARLHLRAGARLLREGKVAEGVATLYDALESAMRSCLADPGRRAGAFLRAGEDPGDAASAYAALVRAGSLDGSFDLAAFSALADQALAGGAPAFDRAALERALESVMVQLGVMPFDGASLPPEGPQRA